ncbi:MAG: hypothetical protein WCX31_17840 [Salinivirgaceae bacterium]|jgi:hypothetical protein
MATLATLRITEMAEPVGNIHGLFNGIYSIYFITTSISVVVYRIAIAG